MPMMFIANLSIVGAAAACYFKAGDQQEKQIVGSSVISGILGITELALFGVLSRNPVTNLKYHFVIKQR